MQNTTENEEIGASAGARSSAGVQLNAPTYRTDDGRLPAVCVEGMTNTDTGIVTDKR